MTYGYGWDSDAKKQPVNTRKIQNYARGKCFLI